MFIINFKSVEHLDMAKFLFIFSLYYINLINTVNHLL
jgi:hypothetical protein